MVNILAILQDMFVGTHRAFKGFTVIFTIYGTGCFVGWLLISNLTQAHLNDDEALADHDQAADDDIENKKEILSKVLIILGTIFYSLSLISFVLK